MVDKLFFLPWFKHFCEIQAIASRKQIRKSANQTVTSGRNVMTGMRIKKEISGITSRKND